MVEGPVDKGHRD